MLSSAEERKFREWLLQCKSERTAERYLTLVREFTSLYGDPRKAKTVAIELWRNYLKNGTPASANTANLRLAALNSFFVFALEKGLIKANPLANVRRKKVPKRLPKPASKAVIKKLLKSTYPDPDPLAEQDRALLLLVYGSGLRREEAAILELDNIQDTTMLRVIGKGNKERTTCLIKPAFRALRDIALKRYGDNRTQLLLRSNKHLPEQRRRDDAFFDLRARRPTAPLFVTALGDPVSSLRDPGNFVWRRLQHMCKRAKVEAHPHMLRHSFATHALGNGAKLLAVQQAMGHESVDTTRQYIELVDDEIEGIGHALETGGAL